MQSWLEDKLIAAAALQLASLEVLERLSAKETKKEPDTLEEYLWSSGSNIGTGDNVRDMGEAGSSGAKGQQRQNLMKLHHSQVIYPLQWASGYSSEPSSGFGQYGPSMDDGALWSSTSDLQCKTAVLAHASWPSQSCESQQRDKGISSRLEPVNRRITQFLKAVEQATLENSWQMAWILTGSADPAPNQVGNHGLAHPQDGGSSATGQGSSNAAGGLNEGGARSTFGQEIQVVDDFQRDASRPLFE
eukprot:44072-Amphidinium_carterae.2